MSNNSPFSIVAWLIYFVILTIAPQSLADTIYDEELSTAISKHQAVDSVSVWARIESAYPPSWIFVRAKSTFSLTDSEIQEVADFSVNLFRAKYPEKKVIRINLYGERRGLEHTISFETQATGLAVRGEESCSDFRCNVGAFLKLESMHDR